MTVENTLNRIAYVGDGSTIEFSFPFGVFTDDDLVVTLDSTVLVLGTDYEVTITDPDDLPSTGKITLISTTTVVPPTSAQTLTIVRTLPYTQAIEISNNGPLPAASLNEAFDRAVILMQQLQDQLTQATMSLGSVVASDFFKLLAVTGNASAARALLQAQELNGNLAALAGLTGSVNKLPYFTGSGTMTMTDLSQFARTLLDDMSAADARTTLGVDSSGGVVWKQLTAGTDFSTSCPSTSSITMITDQTANIKAGTFIKVKMSGGYYVGECVSCSSVLLTIKGITLSTASSALQELYYTTFSDMERDIAQATNRYYIADGSGTDTITATLDPAPPALVDKMHCRIVAAGANTGTVTFNPNTLGAKSVVKLNNVDLVAGDIPGQYFVMDLQYSSSLDKWVFLNSSVVLDGSISTAKLASSSVTQGKLKTSYGAVSGSGNLTLPGGAYGFYPQVKWDGWNAMNARIAENFTTSATYVTNIYIYSTGTAYAQQTYVTSSGEVYWIFVLRDKETKKIKATWCAPDHPCFGNGGKPSLVPHPFGKIGETEEIIVICPTSDQLKAAEDHCTKGDDESDLCISESFFELYDIDDDSEPDWPSTSVTVGITGMQSASGRMVKATAQMAKTAPADTVIEVMKKVIPKPDGVACRAFKAK